MRERLTACISPRASPATASLQPPGSARSSPGSSAAIPTILLATASSFLPLRSASGAATLGLFLSRVPGTRFSISSRDLFFPVGAQHAAHLHGKIDQLVAEALGRHLASAKHQIGGRAEKYRHRPPLPRERVSANQRDYAHQQGRGDDVEHAAASPGN